MPRMRADRFLVERGLFESRAKAQAAIEAGRVKADGIAVRKASDEIEQDAIIDAQPAHPYVSRGGLKLAAALDAFTFDLKGRVCLDVGASTGGFTQVLLERGAARVYAVDVGRGQLHASLRSRPEVVSLEATDIRELQPLNPAPNFVVIDVSFISLKQVIPAALKLLAAPAYLVALIKPQFEAGREAVSRGRGVIRDEDTRLAAIAEARASVESAGFTVLGEIDSAVHGPKGNVERFVHARREGAA